MILNAPHRKGFRLNEDGDEAYSIWLDNFGDRGCTCFLSPPCSYCTHEGHPINVEETPEFWEPDEPAVDVMDTIRAACGSTPRRTIWDKE